jgi:hypothetical protein
MSGHRRKERCYVVVRTQGPSCLRFFLEICNRVAQNNPSEYYSTCCNKVYVLRNRITADRIHKNTTTSSIRGVPYNFPMSINSEPFQGTDISTKPLGPTNYTGSNTAKCKIELHIIQLLNHITLVDQYGCQHHLIMRTGRGDFSDSFLATLPRALTFERPFNFNLLLPITTR